MVVLGVALVACGASPELSQKGYVMWQELNWKGLTVTVIRAAEYSRWFFTIVQATRDLYKRWPS